MGSLNFERRALEFFNRRSWFVISKPRFQPAKSHQPFLPTKDAETFLPINQSPRLDLSAPSPSSLSQRRIRLVHPLVPQLRRGHPEPPRLRLEIPARAHTAPERRVHHARPDPRGRARSRQPAPRLSRRHRRRQPRLEVVRAARPGGGPDRRGRRRFRDGRCRDVNRRGFMGDVNRRRGRKSGPGVDPRGLRSCFLNASDRRLRRDLNRRDLYRRRLDDDRMDRRRLDALGRRRPGYPGDGRPDGRGGTAKVDHGHGPARRSPRRRRRRDLNRRDVNRRRLDDRMDRLLLRHGHRHDGYRRGNNDRRGRRDDRDGNNRIHRRRRSHPRLHPLRGRQGRRRRRRRHVRSRHRRPI